MSGYFEKPEARMLDQFWDDLISQPEKVRDEASELGAGVAEAVIHLHALDASDEAAPAFGSQLWENMMHAYAVPVSAGGAKAPAVLPRRLNGRIANPGASPERIDSARKAMPRLTNARLLFSLAMAAVVLVALSIGIWVNRDPDSPALVPAAVLTQATPEEAKVESSQNVLLDLLVPAGVFTPGPYGAAITFSIIPASSTSTWTTPVSAEVFYVMQGELTLNSQQSWQLVRGATPDVTETVPPGVDATLVEGDLAYFLASFVTTFVNDDEQPVVVALWGMSPAGGGGPPMPPEWTIGAYALTVINFEIPDSAIRVLLRQFHLPPEASVADGPSQIGQLGVQLLSDANGTPTPANQGLYFFGPISNSAADSITVYAITLEAVDQATPTLGTPEAA